MSPAAAAAAILLLPLYCLVYFVPAINVTAISSTIIAAQALEGAAFIATLSGNSWTRGLPPHHLSLFLPNRQATSVAAGAAANEEAVTEENRGGGAVRPAEAMPPTIFGGRPGSQEGGAGPRGHVASVGATAARTPGVGGRGGGVASAGRTTCRVRRGGHRVPPPNCRTRSAWTWRRMGIAVTIRSS